MSEQATPRPWVVMPVGDPGCIGFFIGPNSKANASRAVLRFNSHHALVSALTNARRRLDPFYHPSELFEEADAALALANGESQ